MRRTYGIGNAPRPEVGDRIRVPFEGKVVRATVTALLGDRVEVQLGTPPAGGGGGGGSGGGSGSGGASTYVGGSGGGGGSTFDYSRAIYGRPVAVHTVAEHPIPPGLFDALRAAGWPDRSVKRARVRPDGTWEIELHGTVADVEVKGVLRYGGEAAVRHAQDVVRKATERVIGAPAPAPRTGECPCGGTWGVCEYHGGERR